MKNATILAIALLTYALVVLVGGCTVIVKGDPDQSVLNQQFSTALSGKADAAKVLEFLKQFKADEDKRYGELDARVRKLEPKP